MCLSKHDINILEKIKDPESNPDAGIVLDSSLPRDPNITDASVYERVVAKEREIIRSIQSLEAQLNSLSAEEGKDAAVKGYQQSLSAVEDMISEHPNYASARNNRVQILRRLYGDAMLLADSKDTSMPLIENPDATEKRKAATTALGDMKVSITLLSPPSTTAPISPQVARSPWPTPKGLLYISRQPDYCQLGHWISMRLLMSQNGKDWTLKRLRLETLHLEEDMATLLQRAWLSVSTQQQSFVDKLCEKQ